MIENVGQAFSRNQEFYKKFDKEKIIKQHITKSNPVCFDVGAFQGQSVEFFKSVFKEPLIYSFEPLPKNFKALINKNYTDNMCFKMAVSNFTGETVFYENKISHTSSLLKVNKNSKDSLKISTAISSNDKKLFSSFNKKVKVKTTTLDNFYKSQKLSQIDLLKIDVQGAEAMVIEGALEFFLRNTQAVMIEVSFFDYYEKSNDLYIIEKHLIPLGFNLYSIMDISQNPMNGRTDWIEVFYTKN